MKIEITMTETNWKKLSLGEQQTPGVQIKNSHVEGGMLFKVPMIKDPG